MTALGHDAFLKRKSWQTTPEAFVKYSTRDALWTFIASGQGFVDENMLWPVCYWQSLFLLYFLSSVLHHETECTVLVMKPV